MLSEEDGEKFKLSADEESPESLFRSDADELKLEKLSQHLTLITILIPILIIVILAIAYLDIKHRVTKTETTGTIGVQNLSQDLESRFSSLSLRQAQLEEFQAKQSEAFSQATADVGVKLKSSEEALNHLKNRMADKKELADATAKIGASLDALQAALQKVSAAEETLDTKLTKNLADIAEQLNGSHQRLEKLGRELASLNQAKISREELDLAVKLVKLEYHQTLDEKSKSMEDKFTQLQKRTDALTQQVQSLAAQAKKQAGAILKQPPIKAASEPSRTFQPKPSAPLDTIKPDKIIEQDIP
jgi:chromosome segregation ATPase